MAIAAVVLFLLLALGARRLLQPTEHGEPVPDLQPVVISPVPAGTLYSDDDPPDIWQPFVISEGELINYDGRTSIEIRRIEPDVMELRIDAFPVQPTPRP